MAIRVFVRRLRDGVAIPEYMSEGASGFDLRTAEAAVIKPREWKAVPTGLSFDIPVGHEIQIRSRSGMAVKEGLVIINQPGTVDSDYRGEVFLAILNLSRETKMIDEGQRIAQGVLCPVIQAEFEEVAVLTATRRSSSGMGSTGSK